MISQFAEFRRHWALVLLAALGVGLSISVFGVFGWGLFMLPVSTAFGWSLASVSLGVTILTLTIAATAPLVGVVVGRFGPYRTILVSMPLVAVSMAGFALVDGSPPHFYLMCFLIGFFGLGASPVLWTQLINQTFTAGRGLALGVASCGTAAFLLLVKPGAQAAIQQWGWRAGFLFVAVAPMVTLYPFALILLRPRRTAAIPAAAGDQPHVPAETPGYSALEAVRRWPFIALLAACILASSLGGLLPHLENILRTNGIAPAAIGGFASLVGAGLLMGRLIAGALADRLWAPGVFAALLICGAAGCVGLDLTANPAATTASILALGLLAGGEFALLAFIAAGYFGMRRYGVIFGLLWGVLISAGGVWSFVIGALVDRTGSYAGALQLCAASLCLGAVILFTLGRAPGWRAATA